MVELQMRRVAVWEVVVVMEVVQAGGIALVEGRLVVRRTASGDWVFPKGHVEEGESLEEAAVREMREETGLATRVVNTAGEVIFEHEGELRRVHLFVVQVVNFLPSWPEHLGKDVFLVDAQAAARVLSFHNLSELWESWRARLLEAEHR